MAAKVEAVIGLAERVLGRVGVAHALIGDCARNVYAPPRATRDLRFAIVANAEEYGRLRGELRAAGYTRVTEARAEPSAPIPNVALFSDATGARIDLLLAHSAFEHQAIARAVATDFPAAGVVVPIVCVEDLIIHDVLAGRPQDLVDVEDIAHAQARAGAVIDWAYVERVCAEWDAAEVLRGVRRA